MEGIHVEAGEKSEKQGEAERSCYRLTTASHSPSTLCCTVEEGRGRGGGNEATKLSLGKRVGGKMFEFVFFSHYSNVF